MTMMSSSPFSTSASAEVSHQHPVSPNTVCCISQSNNNNEIDVASLTVDLYDRIFVQTRQQLDEWSEREQHRMTAAAANYKKAVANEQEKINHQIGHLLSLQLETGLKLNNSVDANDDGEAADVPAIVAEDDSIMLLQKEKENIKQEMDSLRKKRDKKKKILQGMFLLSTKEILTKCSGF